MAWVGWVAGWAKVVRGAWEAEHCRRGQQGGELTLAVLKG